MAGKNQVTLTFAGDASKLQDTFSKVGASAKTMGDDVGRASRDIGGGIDNTGQKAGDLESGFRGVTDSMSGFAKIAKGDVLGGLTDLAGGAEALATGFSGVVVPALQRTIARLGETRIGMLASAAATHVMTVAQRALNLAMRLNPIGLVITGIVLLVGALVLAYNKSETFRRIVDGAFAAVRKAVSSVVDFFKGLGPAISKAVGAVTGLLTGKGRDIVTGLAKGVYNNIRGLVTFWVQLPGNVARWIGDTTGTLAGKGSGFLQGLWSGLITKWTSVTRWIGGLKASVSAWLGDTFKWLIGKGRNVLGGFWSGLIEKWRDVTKWVSGIATWIKDHKGPVSLDGGLLVPAGRAIMGGFLKGLQSGAGKAWSFVQSVGGKTVSALRAALGGPLSGGGDPAPTNLSAMQALVRTVAAQRGWGTGPQWDALYNLIMGESGFNPNAQNPTSTAYGMFQFLNSTWGSVGATKTSDPWGQTVAGLRYIANAYGTPANAWAKWQSRSPHWYEQGTPWVPEDTMAFLHRGEAVVPADANRRIRSGSSGVTIIVNGALDPVAVAQQIQKLLRKLKSTNGGLDLGLA